jgi:hypothetical protein
VRVRLLSDLHLEHAAWVPSAAGQNAQDVVVLAGDIDNGLRGIEWAARAFDCPIVYVPGNHEYDFSDLQSARTAFARTDFPPQVHVLDNAVAFIKGVRFLGTTLWTDFALDGEVAKACEDAARCMSDYVRIQHDAQPLTPQHTMALHRSARAWLLQALAQPFDGKTVVVSHHCPHPSCVAPQFKHSPANPAFASDLSDLIHAHTIAAWFHGHTHCSIDHYVGATRILCNPRGYQEHGQGENSQFDPELVIEI